LTAHIRRYAGGRRFAGINNPRRVVMFKYGLAWMLGVPLSLLVVIYLIFRVL